MTALEARLLKLIQEAEDDAGDDSHASVPTYLLRQLLLSQGVEVPEYESERTFDEEGA